MANHINRSKNPEATVKTTIQSRDTEPIQVLTVASGFLERLMWFAMG